MSARTQVVETPHICLLLALYEIIADSEIFRSTITPATLRAHSPPTASTLSPPLSAHTSSRPSTSNSQKPSSIYSPFEKKHTPIPITAPAITPTHMNCYQSHRRILKLPNKHYPVPCMVCKLEDKEQRWKVCVIESSISLRRRFPQNGSTPTRIDVGKFHHPLFLLLLYGVLLTSKSTVVRILLSLGLL